MAPPTVLFLAVQPSALDGYPVEVAWAGADLGAGESWLVKPPAAWADLPWEPEAEALHGLTPERLEDEGVEPRRIAARLVEDLAGCIVACENADVVRALLRILFDESPLHRPPEVMEAAGLRPHAARHDDPDVMRLRARAGITPGQALDDAVALALAWGHAKGLPGDELAADAADLLDYAGR